MPHTEALQRLLRRGVPSHQADPDQSSGYLQDILSRATSIGKPTTAARLPLEGDIANTQQPLGRVLAMAGDPLGAIGGPAKAILPLTSPIRNPGYRQAVKALQELDLQALPAEIGKGFSGWAQRYPRLSAHIAKIMPGSALQEGSSGAYTSAISSSTERPWMRLGLNEALNPQELPQTFAHEGQHIAQSIRMADRARRGVAPSAQMFPGESYTIAEKAAQEAGGGNPWEETYRRLEDKFGYFDSPMEQQARVTQELARTPGQREAATNRALNKQWSFDNPSVDQERFIAAIQRGLANAAPAEFAPVGGEAAWNAAQETARNPLFTKGMPRLVKR